MASSKSSLCTAKKRSGCRPSSSSAQPGPLAQRTRGGHQLGTRVAAPARIEVGEGVADVHRPERSVKIAPEPVVEAQRVQIRRRADLEHDVAGTARVRRAGRDQVQAVTLGRLARDVPLGVERDPGPLRALRVRPERIELGVLEQAEKDRRAGRRRHHVVGLVLRVRRDRRPRGRSSGWGGTGARGDRPPSCRGSRT